jgi:hypothetical protein
LAVPTRSSSTLGVRPFEDESAGTGISAGGPGSAEKLAVGDMVALSRSEREPCGAPFHIVRRAGTATAPLASAPITIHFKPPIATPAFTALVAALALVAMPVVEVATAEGPEVSAEPGLAAAGPASVAVPSVSRELFRARLRASPDARSTEPAWRSARSSPCSSSSTRRFIGHLAHEFAPL